MSLEEIVKEVISNNKHKVQEYTEHKNKKPLNYLVGVVLQKTDGEYNAQEIEKEFNSQFDNINTTVGYPRQISIYHRTDDTRIAEKFSNKLRKELDIPLDSVHFPEQFNVDELVLKYDIHEDGTVEFVNAIK